MGGAEGEDEPPGNENAEDRHGREKTPGLTGPPEMGPPWMPTLPKEETGGAMFSRAAANEGTRGLPTDERTWGPPTKETGGATLPRAATDKKTGGPPTDKPTWGLGERYTAMNIVPTNSASVEDGAHRPAMSSEPNKRR
jgi:hypothetical protein